MLSERVKIFCLLISIILLAVSEARAQALVSARVLSSDGPVEIQRRSQGQTALTKIEYRAGDELLAGDVIRTLKGGRLVLGLTDGSQAIIGENTTLEILDLSRSPRTIFNVLRGKTRVKIEKAGGRPNPYRVNTPTAVIAVRGTLFDVLVTEKETQVFVHEGEVAVSNSAGREEHVILSPGERTRVHPAQPPEPPSRFNPGRNNEIFEPHPRDRGPNGGPAGERGHDRSAPGRGGDRPDRNGQGDPSGRGGPPDGPERGAPPPGMPGPAGPSGGVRPPLQLLSSDN